MAVRSRLNCYIRSDGYPTNSNKRLEDYIAKVTNEMETMVNACKHFICTLSKNELNAPKELKTKKSIVVKLADKRGAIVVLKREDCVDLIMKDLSNKEHYHKLDCDITDEIICEKQKTIEPMKGLESKTLIN